MKRGQVEGFSGRPEKNQKFDQRRQRGKIHCVDIWRFSKSSLESAPRNILYTPDTAGVLILVYFLPLKKKKQNSNFEKRQKLFNHF